MALYSVETRRSPEEVVEEAAGYFGENGLGLTMSRESPCCATFVGGGGHVKVTASQEKGKTTVKLETREWDYRVKAFMGRV